MSRSDLEALAESEASRTDFECGNYRHRDLLAFAHRVARHERARCAKALRAACDRHFESIRIWKLRQLADEMENDK